MKGLLKFLSPFAPDQSGAASVLYEMGGITVICDAGGCTGNICGFDEPRWFEKKSAVFSAGLRDMDAIFGRDDALINKAADAAEKIDAAFIALIGTPVPAVVGTDFRALEKMAEKRCGLPVLALPCTGTRTYEEGEEEAWEKLFRRFAAGKEGGEGKTPAERTFMPEEPAQASAGPAQATAGLVQASVRQAPESGRLGVIGMTPLSVSRTDGDRFLREKFAGGGWKRICCYGMGGTLEEVRQAGKAEKNLVVSPPGIRTAEYLRRTFGTPYETAYPFLTAKEMESLHRLAGKRVLVIHQQIAADEIRKEIRRGFAGISGDGEITAATFFLQSRELMEPQDLHLSSEEDLVRAVQGGKYEAVVGDAAFRRVLRDFDGEYVEIPHFAVSGALEKE